MKVLITQHYEIIIVKAEKQISSNLDADKVNKGKTNKTFTVGLSTNGKLPVMHYWCCWWVSDKEAEDLRKDFDTTLSGNKNMSKMYNLSEGWTPDKVLEDMKLKRIDLEQIGLDDEKRVGIAVSSLFKKC